MKFDIKGIDPSHPDVQAFREEWIQLTRDENGLLSGGRYMSGLQKMVIDLCCGYDSPYMLINPTSFGEMVISSDYPPQQEMEALFRARNRALANALQRGFDNAAILP